MFSFEHEDQDDTTSSPGPSVGALRMSSQKKGQKDIADLASLHIEHLGYIIIVFAEVLNSYVINAANAAIVKTRTRNAYNYITIDRKLLIIIDILFEYVICIQNCSFITLIIENIAFNFLQIISFK